MSEIKAERRIWIRAISVVAIGFGLLTLREGGMILFGNEPARPDVALSRSWL